MQLYTLCRLLDSLFHFAVSDTGIFFLAVGKNTEYQGIVIAILVVYLVDALLVRFASVEIDVVFQCGTMVETAHRRVLFGRTSCDKSN